MGFDKDLKALIVATKKAASPLGEALEQQRKKLRMKREMAEASTVEPTEPSMGSDKAELWNGRAGQIRPNRAPGNLNHALLAHGMMANPNGDDLEDTIAKAQCLLATAEHERDDLLELIEVLQTLVTALRDRSLMLGTKAADELPAQE